MSARVRSGARRAVLLAWARAQQRRLAHACDLEITVGPGVTWATLPAIELTRQELGAAPGRGRIRLEIEGGVHLGRRTVVEVLPTQDARLVLEAGAVLFAGVRLVLFGGEVHVGRGTRLRDGVTLKSSGVLRVGAHGFVNNFSMVHCAERVELGEHPQLAERVTLIDSDHRADGSDTYIQLLPAESTPVLIGPNVWIGANAVVLRGARIGANAVVAANSTVRGGDYAAGQLIAGAPATARKAL